MQSLAEHTLPLSDRRGPEFGLPQSVIDGHQETLEMGKLADVLIINGDPIRDIGVLTERAKFLAVMQGGVIKAGTLAKPFPTVVTSEMR